MKTEYFQTCLMIQRKDFFKSLLATKFSQDYFRPGRYTYEIKSLHPVRILFQHFIPVLLSKPLKKLQIKSETLAVGTNVLSQGQDNDISQVVVTHNE